MAWTKTIPELNTATVLNSVDQLVNSQWWEAKNITAQIVADTVPTLNTDITTNDWTQTLTNKDLTSGTNTFPTLNQDTTWKSANTDALKSATTTVNVASATAPTVNQVLMATSDSAAIWQDVAVASATETTEWVVERLTDAEAETWTDTTRYASIKQIDDNYSTDYISWDSQSWVSWSKTIPAWTKKIVVNCHLNTYQNDADYRYCDWQVSVYTDWCTSVKYQPEEWASSGHYNLSYSISWSTLSITWIEASSWSSSSTIYYYKG